MKLKRLFAIYLHSDLLFYTFRLVTSRLVVIKEPIVFGIIVLKFVFWIIFIFIFFYFMKS